MTGPSGLLFNGVFSAFLRAILEVSSASEVVASSVMVMNIKSRSFVWIFIYIDY